MKQKYFCPHCKMQIRYKFTSPGYFANCKRCNEDFYRFELIKSTKKEIRKWIN